MEEEVRKSKKEEKEGRIKEREQKIDTITAGLDLVVS